MQIFKFLLDPFEVFMATADLPRILPYQPMRMSVERYHQLSKLGAFTDNDQVELLDGVVTEKMPKNPSHSIANRRIDLAISGLTKVGWHIRNQEPITLSNSEPEPDLAIVLGRIDDYIERHPLAREVALVIEVADTSLVTDRYKAELYAEAGIPEYWIVNLVDRVIEVFRFDSESSTSLRYPMPQIFDSQSEITVTINGQTWGALPVSELLGL